MPTRIVAPPRAVTTTEASVLALLAIEGERSAYDLLKFAGRAIGYVWAPARSQLYTLLPRLARDGLATQRKLAQSDRPDKHLYRISREGRRALRAWLTDVEPGAVEPFMLKLFVGGLMPRAQAAAHVEQFRLDTEERLAEYRRIEPTNTHTGHDEFHYFLLRRAIEHAEHDLEWADWVLAELG